MSIINAVRNASTSALSTGKHKVVVVGAGSGGLAVANQLWNALKSEGGELGQGDVAVIDVSTRMKRQAYERGRGSELRGEV